MNVSIISNLLSNLRLNTLPHSTAVIAAAVVVVVAVIAVALIHRRRRAGAKIEGVEEEGGIKDSLRLFIPGMYPPQLLEEYRDDFKKAGILFPEKYLRNISIASSTIALTLAVIGFLLGTLFRSHIILSLPISIPIPDWTRPYIYAITAYTSQPFIFTILFVASLKGKISSRREDIDFNLHTLYITLLGFAKAGISIMEAVKELVTMDLGEISKEFARIYYAVRYGNTTLKAAMLEVAATTPSAKLADLLRGIVGVMEAGGDLGRYMEERIESLEVERKIMYTEYLKKLEMIAEVYLTVSLAIPTMVVSIQLAKSIAGQADISMVYGLVYGFMPLSSLALIIALYGLSPEKGVERPGIKRLAVIPAAALIGVLLGVLSHLHHIPGNLEFWTLALTVIGSAVSAVMLRKWIKEDEKLSAQLPLYFNRVLSLAEAGKDTTTAFKLAAEEARPPLSKYVKVFAEMLDRGISRDRAFQWLFRITPSTDLRLAARILSKTVDVSGRVTQVLISLVGELMRLNAFRKERDSVAKTYGGMMVLAALLFLGIAVAISAMLLGQFEKLGQATTAAAGSGRSLGFSISPFVINQVRTVLRHASYIVSMSAAVGVAATRGDLRRIASPLAVMLSVTLITGILFMNLL
ncbi:Type II secretion system F domain protein [Ferroglobus placidus DSM 10642]|uniref:Type II secretion system F domain protein n=1 Tax=Ferroglobus placidus (strain DSM 10642 / AEDII12DO) TaxID=589924 RepID=D3S3B5_FERPA|nr:type II secretion system F family protein [Ferroglobus placidus]ADC64748.1 Type II secretion system F domain protein [Ferroglobus placidus DSM 10642]